MVTQPSTRQQGLFLKYKVGLVYLQIYLFEHLPNSNSITYRRIITKNPMMKALMMTRKLNTKDPEDCIAAVSSPGISIIEYQYSTQAPKSFENLKSFENPFSCLLQFGTGSLNGIIRLVHDLALEQTALNPNKSSYFRASSQVKGVIKNVQFEIIQTHLSAYIHIILLNYFI